MRRDWKNIKLGNIYNKTRASFVSLSNLLFLLVFCIIVYALFIYVLNNISNETATNILDYIRALAWPIVVLIAVFFFKGNIAGLIERIEEGEVPGVANFKAPQQTAKKEDHLDFASKGGIFDEIIKEKEDKINNLKQDTEELIDKLAWTEISLDFERIFNVIFASQIALLHTIDRSVKLTNAHIKERYHTIKEMHGSTFAVWDIEQYMSFLWSSDLLIKEGYNVLLSPKGKSFLKYLEYRKYEKYGI